MTHAQRMKIALLTLALVLMSPGAGSEAPTIKLDPALNGESWLWARPGDRVFKSSPAPLLQEVIREEAPRTRARAGLVLAAGEDRVLDAAELKTWAAGWDVELPGFLLAPPGAGNLPAIRFMSDDPKGQVSGTLIQIQQMNAMKPDQEQLYLIPVVGRLLTEVRPTDQAEANQQLISRVIMKLEAVRKAGGIDAEYAIEDIERIKSGGRPIPMGPGEMAWQAVSREAAREGWFDTTDLARRLERLAEEGIQQKIVSTSQVTSGKFGFTDVTPGRYLLYCGSELMLFLYYVEVAPGATVNVNCLLPLEHRRMRSFAPMPTGS